MINLSRKAAFWYSSYGNELNLKIHQSKGMVTKLRLKKFTWGDIQPDCSADLLVSDPCLSTINPLPDTRFNVLPGPPQLAWRSSSRTCFRPGLLHLAWIPANPACTAVWHLQRALPCCVWCRKCCLVRFVCALCLSTTIDNRMDVSRREACCRTLLPE